MCQAKEDLPWQNQEVLCENQKAKWVHHQRKMHLLEQK